MVRSLRSHTRIYARKLYGYMLDMSVMINLVMGCVLVHI